MREIDRVRTDVKVYTGIDTNTECFLYYNTDGKPCVAAYTGKRNKASFRYRYKSDDDAINSILLFIQNEALKIKAKEERKIEDKKIQQELFDIVEVGSIFVSSWGYDQTNVDAYQVIEKKGSSTIVLKEIGLSTVEDSNYGNMSCNVIPVKDSFMENSEPFEKRINRFGISMSSYSSASLWDGKSDYYRSWYA